MKGHVGLVCLMLVGCAHEATVVPKPPLVAPADVPIIQDFNARVKRYVEVRDTAEKNLPKLSDKAEAANIAAHRDALTEAILKARPGAQQGEVFTPEIRPYFSRVIRSELRGSDGEPAREAVKEGNPRYGENSGPVVIQVNRRYPDKQPSSVVPPTLLVRLPELPEGMSYRFVGRDLILRDEKTGLVIDIFPAAAPRLVGVKS